jgi:coniferyl-aldehyde dehydrogenase
MAALPRVEHTQLFINNKFLDSVAGRTFETVNPTDETVIARVAEADR